MSQFMLNASLIRWFLLISVLVLSSCSQPKRLNPLTSYDKILAFGDSLTYGTGAAKGHSYPEQLAKLTQLTVINSGIPGELSAEGVARLPQVIQQHQPKLLLLCHGGNDLLRKQDLSQLKQNLITMIETARQQNIEVMLIGVPEVKIFGGIHPVYQQVAEELDVPIESEVLSKLLKDNQYKSDYVHLNNAGYKKLAEHIKQLMHDEGALYGG